MNKLLLSTVTNTAQTSTWHGICNARFLDMCHVNTVPLSDTITVLLIKGRQLMWRIFIILDSSDKANGGDMWGQTRMTLFRCSFLKINTQYTLVLSEWADCDKRCIIMIRQVSVSAVTCNHSHYHQIERLTACADHLDQGFLKWGPGTRGGHRGPWTSLVKSSLKIYIINIKNKI